MVEGKEGEVSSTRLLEREDSSERADERVRAALLRSALPCAALLCPRRDLRTGETDGLRRSRAGFHCLLLPSQQKGNVSPQQ